MAMTRDEARRLAQAYIDALEPPADDEWVVTGIDERDWGWVVSWLNQRANAGSQDPRDWHAGGGPLRIDRDTGRVAMCGSACPAEHYIPLWRAGQWPDLQQP